MENASQALLIAGGVLLAILTITAFMLMLTNATTIKGAEQNSQDIQRLIKWNAEWEAYNKQALYGTDVLSVINKAKQNNSDYQGNEKYYVYVKIYTLNRRGELEEIPGSEAYVRNSVYSKQTQVFKCIDMERNEETGRIQTIKFQEI